MMGLAYADAASFIVAIPNTSNVIKGINAVAGTGIASVAHQIAIHIPTPAVRHASVDIVVCWSSNIIMSANNNGPRINPMF